MAGTRQVRSAQVREVQNLPSHAILLREAQARVRHARRSDCDDLTRKAATELRERSGTALLRRVNSALANSMGQARIGTVK